MDEQRYAGALMGGKTAWIASRIEEGMQRGSVLAVSATPQTVRSLRHALDERGLGQVPVRTYLDVASWVLEQPDEQGKSACALFGRPSMRILNAAEERFFWEDMKTLGMKQRRLRSMLSYFLHGYDELKDADPCWVQTAEEEQMLALMHDRLRFTGGVLEFEACNFALKWLDALAGSAPLFDGVFVDDWHLLPGSAHALLRALAGSQLAYAEEPSKARVGASADAGDRTVADAGLPMGQNEQAGGQEEPLALSAPHAGRTVWHASIEEELRGVVAEAQRAVEERGSAPDAGVVFIAGAHPVWRANVLRALRACGMSAQPAPSAKRPELRGDLREVRRFAPALADARARFRENPDDGLALRSLMGFGDFVGQSNVVMDMMRAGLPAGETLASMLAKQAANSGDAPEAFLAKRSEALAGAVAAQDAQAAACHKEAGPLGKAGAPDEHSGVVVGHPADALGLKVSTMIFGACVCGLVPSRGCSMRDAAIALTRTDDVHISGFASCDLETAERLGVHIERIRLKNGLRTAFLEPSQVCSL